MERKIVIAIEQILGVPIAALHPVSNGTQSGPRIDMHADLHVAYSLR
jgi:hypothetical protein